MKVLCIHGIGHQEAASSVWQPLWQEAIGDNISAFTPGGTAPAIEFLDYDDLFEEPLANLSYRDFATAFWNLSAGAFARPRGLLDFSDATRWYAGMVVIWINNEDLRDQLQERLLQKIEEVSPDLICAHSLGSLIAYDTFARNDDAIRDRTLITFGSQIGNVFVRGSVFAGRVEPLAPARHWFHLFNPNDHVFTAPLDFGDFQTADNFGQVITLFGNVLSGFSANHTAVDPNDPDNSDQAYLSHPQTREVVWPQVAAAPVVRALAAPARAVEEVAKVAVPDRRALLAGINAYPNVAQRLEGCVNDVFLVSSVLQESGFSAEDIRVVLDDRATAEGIRERLHWLLDGVNAGDTRFFYYSGHGAQMPLYGPEGKIDRVAATLVPYDFNWKPETALTDHDLVNFYSQLPYDARMLMVLDCCYSGGMTRGGTRARGLDPPDDIRHRMLRWDVDRQMWVSRDLPPLNKDLSKLKNARQFVGETGATVRLGRGVSLRVAPDKEYDRDRKELGHKGPFMPIIYEACGEKEYAYEYQHGAIAHGAFTYAMAAILRRERTLTFAELLKETAKVLTELRYEQHPEMAGPKALLKDRVPWQGPGTGPVGGREV
jgi:hypothetical protein